MFSKLLINKVWENINATSIENCIKINESLYLAITSGFEFETTVLKSNVFIQFNCRINYHISLKHQNLTNILKLSSLGVNRFGIAKTLLEKSLISRQEIVFRLSSKLNISRLAQMFSRLRNGWWLLRLYFSVSSNSTLKPISTLK